MSKFAHRFKLAPAPADDVDRGIQTWLKLPGAALLAMLAIAPVASGLLPEAVADEYKPAPVTSLSRQGANYFKQLNCLSCHAARGVGGDLGPALDAIGSRRSSDYLFARLAESAGEQERFAKFPGASYCSLGTHPRLSDQCSKAMVAFLLTLGAYKANPHASPHGGVLAADEPKANNKFVANAASPDSEEGKKLYQKNACASCHAIGEVGGWVGPSLDGIGGRHSLAYIKEYIAGPRAVLGDDGPKSRMPTLPLTADEVNKIAAFLLTVPNLDSVHQ